MFADFKNAVNAEWSAQDALILMKICGGLMSSDSLLESSFKIENLFCVDTNWFCDVETLCDDGILFVSISESKVSEDNISN